MSGSTATLPARRRPWTAAINADMRDGARAMAPMLVAYVPFGLLVGAAVAASANPPAAWLATFTIYGGAAHLAVLDVLRTGSGWVAAAAVGLLVNARLSAYATAMAPQWRTAPVRRRLLAGLLLTDAPWALTRTRESGQRDFYLGAGVTLFLGWPALVTAGALVGDRIGAVPVTGLLAAMSLGAIVVPQLRQRPVAAAVAVATVTAVVTADLPAGLSLGAAAVLGAGAGVLAEARRGSAS